MYYIRILYGETCLSIIPPYILHCRDDVPDDNDMVEICCA